MKRIAFTALLVWCSPASAAPSDLEQVTAAANGFYGVYGTFHPSDGIPDASGRAKYEPFISPALDSLLIDGDAAESHFEEVMKNMSPPLIEGDLFTSNFEGATSWHLGACTMRANAAQCPVTLGYADTTKKKERKAVQLDGHTLSRARRRKLARGRRRLWRKLGFRQQGADDANAEKRDPRRQRGHALKRSRDGTSLAFEPKT